MGTVDPMDDLEPFSAIDELARRRGRNGTAAAGPDLR